LNCSAPDSGIEEINTGGISSTGPPLGGEIAAQDKIINKKIIPHNFL